MGDKTRIEWADATWNPVAGCTAVSEGCHNCYAAGLASRFSGEGLQYEGLAKQRKGRRPHWTGRIQFNQELMDKPNRWQRPRRIFVCSMADLFHDGVTDEQLDAIFAKMLEVNRHEYMVLTKRPERMVSYLEGSDLWNNGEPLDRAHIWFGVSAESQRWADNRIPLLMRAPVVRRFVSAEPLLGSIASMPLKGYGCSTCHHPMPDNAGGYCPMCLNGSFAYQQMIDMVIVGGESGPNARPMHPVWVSEIRDQCEAAGTMFFFKQWGEWGPLGQHPHAIEDKRYTKVAITPGGERLSIKEMPGGPHMVKVGKKKSGAVFGNRTYQEFPKPLLAATMFEREQTIG